MGKIRRGGYIIYFWIGDHEPRHIHVLKEGKFIAKVRLSDLAILEGRLNKRLLKILESLKRERRI